MELMYGTHGVYGLADDGEELTLDRLELLKVDFLLSLALRPKHK